MSQVQGPKTCPHTVVNRSIRTVTGHTCLVRPNNFHGSQVTRPLYQKFLVTAASRRSLLPYKVVFQLVCPNFFIRSQGHNPFVRNVQTIRGVTGHTPVRIERFTTVGQFFQTQDYRTSFSLSSQINSRLFPDILNIVRLTEVV